MLPASFASVLWYLLTGKPKNKTYWSKMLENFKFLFDY